MSKQGVILLNLGSPDSTEVGDVRRYLREFLMDGRVSMRHLQFAGFWLTA